MFVLKIKYKSFLIHSAKKKNLTIKKNFLVNSIIWSLEFRKQPISEAFGSFQNINDLLEKKSMEVFILSNVVGGRIGT